MSSIRAARREEIAASSGDWAFVDLGFSQDRKSCGLLINNSTARNLRFSDLSSELVALATDRSTPLNLVLEAPLSIAFAANGNPTGRSIEKQGAQTRYWYCGLGCSVLIAATYLLRAIVDAQPSREVRLIEGLVSFKPKGVRSSHVQDVEGLRDIAWGSTQRAGCIVSAEDLKGSASDKIVSAFAVSGMDFGVPPVIVVDS